MLWEEWLPALAPGWLQRQWGGGYLRAVGAEQDELLSEVIQARKAMMPNYAGAGPATDALPIIGAERGLERGPSDTDASYGERLRRAWETLPTRGSPRGLLTQLRVMGFDWERLNYIQRSGRRVKLALDGTVTISDGPIWTFDGKSPLAYAQYGLLFETDQPTITWSGGAGFSAEAALLNRLAYRWRNSKAEFMGTWILGTGRIWGWPTTVNWGTGTWGGSGGRHIPPR